MGSLRNDTRPQKKALWAGAGDSVRRWRRPGVVSIKRLSWTECQALDGPVQTVPCVEEQS